MTTENTEQKEQKKRSQTYNVGDLVTQSIWNAITWLPAMVLAAFIDDD